MKKNETHMDRPAQLTALLLEAANPEKARHLMRFFKTGAGQYGHGDQFLGLPVPRVRSLIAPFAGTLTLSECGGLLDSPWHEIRLAALLLMVNFAARAAKQRNLPELARLVALYDQRLDRANNWDLVDLSVYNIMGAYWNCANTHREERRRFLTQWAGSGNLWRERAAMVATLALIRKGDLEDTFWLVEYFMDHPHDLMRKACGWMLREAGKKQLDALRAFLEVFAGRLPRTTLRYAVERMEPAERRKWMERRQAPAGLRP